MHRESDSGSVVAQLVFSGDPKLSTVVPHQLQFTRFPAQIGRGLSNLRVTPSLLGLVDGNGQLVSREHARVAVAADGSIRLHDCDAVNGTWVDGKRLPRGGSAGLSNGTTVAFGHLAIQYTIDFASCFTRYNGKTGTTTEADQTDAPECAELPSPKRRRPNDLKHANERQENASEPRTKAPPDKEPVPHSAPAGAIEEDSKCCVCRDPIALAASLRCGHLTWY